MLKTKQYINLYLKKFKKTLNLIASENFLPPSSKCALINEIYNRYCFDDDETFFFPDRECLQNIKENCVNMLRLLLNVKYVNLKAISGLNCMTLVLGFLRKKYKCFISLDPISGGHGVTRTLAKEFNLNTKYLRLNKTLDIDLESLKKIVCNYNENETVLYIDHMNVLFPLDIEKIRNAFPKMLIIYDVSHILGLILGKAFPNPLEFGADILVGSTHKTFPGPHKGIIATNKLLISKQMKFYSEVFISHEHICDTAILALTLENNKHQLKKYASRTIENAYVFAENLYKNDINVLFRNLGFTRTHQIWIDVADSKDEVYEIVERLASYGIVVNAIILPVISKWGIRVGMNEISQRLSANDVAELALYFALICKNSITKDQGKILVGIIKKYHRKRSILN